MTSERSPLLAGTGSSDPEAGPSRSRRDEQLLATRAVRLIGDLKRSYRRGESLEGVARTAASHDTAELATLLYAASVPDDSRVAGTSSIRDRLAQVAIHDRLREAIYNRIEDLLDGESQALLSDDDGRSFGSVTAEPIPEECSKIDGEVEEMCWKQWDEDGSGRQTVSGVPSSMTWTSYGQLTSSHGFAASAQTDKVVAFPLTSADPTRRASGMAPGNAMQRDVRKTSPQTGFLSPSQPEVRRRYSFRDYEADRGAGHGTHCTSAVWRSCMLRHCPWRFGLPAASSHTTTMIRSLDASAMPS